MRIKIPRGKCLVLHHKFAETQGGGYAGNLVFVNGAQHSHDAGASPPVSRSIIPVRRLCHVVIIDGTVCFPDPKIMNCIVLNEVTTSLSGENATQQSNGRVTKKYNFFANRHNF